MDSRVLLILACTSALASAWSLPYYPVPRAPMRYTRFAPPPPPHLRYQIKPHLVPHHRIPLPVESSEQEEPQQQRPKRGHDDYDHDDHEHKNTRGITGPVHTFVKTDKNANYKWGVRHHVGDKYAP